MQFSVIQTGMSPIDTSIDCVHQRIKRKFDDYAAAEDDDFSSDLVSPRMRKDEPKAVDSCSDHFSPSHRTSYFEPRVSDSQSSVCSSSFSFSSRLQFFVRMMSDGKTLVLHGNPKDSVKSVHEKIQSITGIPVIEQGLIYRGKQLQWEQSLDECSIENDAGLQLVGRMRSTGHPQAWQVVNEVVSVACRMCKNEMRCPSSILKSRLQDFVNMIPRLAPEQAAAHLHIFMSSCAPAALVMLYLSPLEGNMDCAKGLIECFIATSKRTLSKIVYSQCTPILLEFCNLLGRGAHGDPLYNSCRSTLGSMVEYVSAGRGLKAGDGCDGIISVHDIFPFFFEIAAGLSKSLLSSAEFDLGLGPSPNDVVDFTAFLQPIKTAIADQVVSSGGPIPISNCEETGFNLSCYEAEIKFLHFIFTDLLDNMEKWLELLESRLASKEKTDVGWNHYLVILKELNGISKLYQGTEDQFWTMLRTRKASFCSLIVISARRAEDHVWILGHKDVTNFESRRHLVMLLLPELKDEYEELHQMLIDRSQLLAESFEYIGRTDSDTLRGGLFLEFKNEEATGPGVLREWFVLVCQALFNPQNALFIACPNDCRRFLPNPASMVNPLHLEYFNFSGRVIALALMHKVQVGIVLDRVFFLQLAGTTVSLEDIRDADPVLYSSCKKILHMDPDTIDQDILGLTFVREVEELGSRKVVELCTDGRSIVVNSKNRKQYVDLLIQHHFVTSISERVAHFAQGFADIVASSRVQRLFFQSLVLEDLDWMLYGSESALCMEDWRAHTDYNGYKQTDPQVLWFWKIVGGMTAEQRKGLLFFWTSLKYLPIEGFGGLASRLHIYKSRVPFDRLPSSHTCFYRLCFPPYPSMDVMQDRIHLIAQDCVSSSFGTW